MFCELKKIRKEMGLSINDVSQKLKIQKRYLEAIENGDYIHLPCRVYAVGFIKNYANFLKIDPTEIIAKFDDEIINGKHKQIPLFNENGENLKYSTENIQKFTKAAGEYFRNKSEAMLLILILVILIGILLII